MSVIRIRKSRENPYVVLDKTALNDAGLSFMAKGLHAYLMSKPDDWNISLKQLENTSPKEGRKAIRKAMQELENAGYLTRHWTKDKKGRMTGWDFAIYETPRLAKLVEEDSKLTSPTDPLVPDGLVPDGKPPDGKEHLLIKKTLTHYREKPNTEKKPPLSPPQNGGGTQHGGDRTRRKRRRGQVSHDGIIEWMREKTQEMAPCTPKTSKSLAP